MRAANVRHPGLRTLQVMTYRMDVLKFSISPNMSLQIHHSTPLQISCNPTFCSHMPAIHIVQKQSKKREKKLA